MNNQFKPIHENQDEDESVKNVRQIDLSNNISEPVSDRIENLKAKNKRNFK